MYNLNNNWTCWIHYQNDNIWTLDRYKNIITVSNLKDAVLFIENLDENIIKKSMLFFMKVSREKNFSNIIKFDVCSVYYPFLSTFPKQ
jgi:hypothetical protein